MQLVSLPSLGSPTKAEQSFQHKNNAHQSSTHSKTNKTERKHYPIKQLQMVKDRP